MTYQEAHMLASRKAKYGHRDWLVWKDKDDTGHADVLTRMTMKQCLLATGTQGQWKLIGANDGIGMIGHWWLGVHILRQRR